MRIGIDIDDTLTETSKIMTKLATEKNHLYGNELLYDLANMLRGTITNPNTKRFFIDNVEEACGKAEIKKDAKEVIDMLLEDGHEIYFITARSELYFKDPYEFTKKYLEKNKINYTKLIVGHENKLNICKESGIDVFFDDAYDTTKDLYNEGIDAVLFTSVNNYYLCTSLNRVKNWKELYEYVCNK